MPDENAPAKLVASNNKPVASNKRCPICGKPAMETVAPFCSRRCADVDLHRWLGGVYAVPADGSDEDEPGDHEGLE